MHRFLRMILGVECLPASRSRGESDIAAVAVIIILANKKVHHRSCTSGAGNIELSKIL